MDRHLGRHLHKIRLSDSLSEIYELADAQGNAYAQAHIEQSSEVRVWINMLDNEVFEISEFNRDYVAGCCYLSEKGVELAPI